MASKRKRVQTKGAVPDGYVPVEDVRLRGFELVQHMPKSSYRDNSMVIICPMRTPMIHHKVVQSWQQLQFPMNQRRAQFMISGAEVGAAYTEQIKAVLAHPELSKWQYVLTLEDDNLPPPDAVLLLLEAIEAGPFDAVGGLYFLRGDFAMGQCYGDPAEYSRTGIMDFRPRDVVAAIKQGAIVPCLGIAMGCSLYRLDCFRKTAYPWFETTPQGTQDLNWSKKAITAGLRLACDTRCRVGHLDVTTNVVY